MLCIFFFFSYINYDPMKCCLFIVFGLILLCPFLSFSVNLFFCYFICLLFLSGIFTILVYFTSLSSFSFFYFFFFEIFISVFFFFYFSFFYFGFFFSLNITLIYFFFFFFFFIFIIFFFFFFLVFISFFLNFSGSLRGF